MEPHRTKTLESGNEPAINILLENEDERLAAVHSSNEKSNAKAKLLPNHSMSQTQAFDEENLTKPKSRFLRACHALDAYLASFFIKKEYTWRGYLLRLIPGFMAGIFGALAWRWVTLGWRPWTRTPEEQALWCKSSGVGSLFL
ncbi:hypothetical protein E8E11_002262 [Didymella keratinophila]|nr:hypothetical protein E8E11_002262 [Didymella keratinophila]